MGACAGTERSDTLYSAFAFYLAYISMNQHDQRSCPRSALRDNRAVAVHLGYCRFNIRGAPVGSQAIARQRVSLRLGRSLVPEVPAKPVGIAENGRYAQRPHICVYVGAVLCRLHSKKCCAVHCALIKNGKEF